jgi:bifunctional DNA-binding transcriptional regulator/antitoxin component of YhaV-PrlF toxin-antitoxin module
MPFQFKVKLNKMRYSLWFVVPKQVADYLELAAGDTLAIEVTDHTMVVKKAGAVPEIAADAEQLAAPKESREGPGSNKLFRSKFK